MFEEHVTIILKSFLRIAELVFFYNQITQIYSNILNVEYAWQKYFLHRRIMVITNTNQLLKKDTESAVLFRFVFTNVIVDLDMMIGG